MRKQFNRDFFEKLNSNSAYALGLIAADGTIVSNRPAIRLELHKSDFHIIKDIAHAMNYKGKFYDSRNNKLLTLNSKRLRDDIEKYGLKPRKSLTLEYPNNIPADIEKDFIRGYFDGDGEFRVETRNNNKVKAGYPRVRVSGTKKFLKEMSKKVNIERYYLAERCNGKIFRIQYSGNVALQFMNFIYYNNMNLFLNRKHNKYEKYKRNFPKRYNQFSKNDK